MMALQYGVDAAILFSDILVVPASVYGQELSMPGGVGIRVDNPIRRPSDFARLPYNDPQVCLSHVYTAIQQINSTLSHEGFFSTPLVGFSAAPFTLMYFMCRDREHADHESASNFMHAFPDDSVAMLQSLETAVVEYMSAQVQSGVHAVQLFEAMGQHISQKDFETFAQPRLDSIGQRFKARHPDTPLMLFTRDAMHSLRACQRAHYDVLTLDCSVDGASTREYLKQCASEDGLQAPVALQGNLDPNLLMRSGDSESDLIADRACITDRAHALVDQLGPQGLIANVCGGLTGKEDPELVSTFVSEIQSISCEDR
jgi:uroporphyrinogen decarboxylase